MIRREKVHALILSRRNTGEADRRLTLFTRDYGLLRVVAKGVRKIPSRRGGYLEPFTHVLALVTGSSQHYYLAAVEPLEAYSQLRADASALAHAGNVAALILHLFAEDQAHESVFDALAHAWEMLPGLNAAQQTLLEMAVTLHALGEAGYAPELDTCQKCGTSEPRDAVIFNSNGGWRCLPCHGSLAGAHASVSPRLLKAIRFLDRFPEKALRLQITHEESQQIAAALRRYVSEVTGQQLRWQEEAVHYAYAR